MLGVRYFFSGEPSPPGSEAREGAQALLAGQRYGLGKSMSLLTGGEAALSVDPF